ncbi:hypothetical protein HOD20_06480 [archaeon]|jgi:hypothetical protein|nr:hypothetical protein [archaeon]MBT4648287.1 hypothetical protein [archaeon]MBT6821539.1 hypothetical protein [archaeon]MBT7391938.1 hypothetical protein [archaeon]
MKIKNILLITLVGLMILISGCGGAAEVPVEKPDSVEGLEQLGIDSKPVRGNQLEFNLNI